MFDPRDPEAVVHALQQGTLANRDARCRRASCDVIPPQGRLIATGDLHDNPLNFDRALDLAALDQPDPHHLTLHELIHSEHLVHGVDLSYRALVKAADLKAQHPEHVHLLLANHELSQIAGAGIIKDGVNVVKAFNDGVEYVFGSDADDVLDAIAQFIRSLPLALRCESPTGAGDFLCAHSLPDPDLFDRFDPGILDRELEEADYTPRRGSAHLMVWGRDHTPDQLTTLAHCWNAAAFILGHEKAEHGWFLREPNCLVLNTDHAHAAIADIPLDQPITPDTLRAAVRSLSAV